MLIRAVHDDVYGSNNSTTQIPNLVGHYDIPLFVVVSSLFFFLLKISQWKSHVPAAIYERERKMRRQCFGLEALDSNLAIAKEFAKRKQRAYRVTEPGSLIVNIRNFPRRRAPLKMRRLKKDCKILNLFHPLEISKTQMIFNRVSEKLQYGEYAYAVL